MKVLIVDDEEDVRTFLTSFIEALDCDQIDTAETGEAALGLAVRTQYDLVTLDLKMPGVSGIDIISVLRGMMPWAVLAVVSGYVEDITDQAREHTDLVIHKPVPVETMQNLVRLTRELRAKRDAIRNLGKGSDH